MGINYPEIRERLMALKKSQNLDNYEFCKIYAPEKCSSETNAKNYISALSTGRNYPDDKHGPLLPDLEHLQNIVDSELFPDVTLDYLVYGDETPIKTIEKIDVNPEHWTIADFCVFLGKIMDSHQSIKTDTVIEEESNMVDGQEYGESMSYFTIKILEYSGFDSSGYDLGEAISEFVSQYKKMKSIPSKTAQEVMYKQLKNAIYSDERYAKQKLTSHKENSFWISDKYNGEVFDGLKLE